MKRGKVPRSNWTADEIEFDRIMSMLESRMQMDRIEGRILWPKFTARFTQEQLDAMATRIGARRV